MKMLRLTGAAIVLFAAAPLAAQELFPNNEPASSIPKGVIGVRVFGESFHEVRTQRNMAMLRLMYGLTPKLSLTFSSGLSNHHGAVLPKDLVTHTHLGSQTIYYTQAIQKGVTYPYRWTRFHAYAKYRFLSDDGQNRHFRMAAYGEWSNVRQAHDEAEPNLADDTKGYGGGLITTWLKGHFAVSLTSGFVVPGAYEEDVPAGGGSTQVFHTRLEYGRALKYDLSFGYLLYPKHYEDYSQTNWNVYLELEGKSYEAAKVFQDGVQLETQSNALKAGHYIEAHPGVQKIFDSNLRLDFSVGFSLLNRSYVHYYPLFMVGIQRYFYPGNRKH